MLKLARITAAPHRSPARRAGATSCWPASPANHRLSDALYQWACTALTSSAEARALYDAHHAQGATHHSALRALSNRLVGILHGCLRHYTAYNPAIAWPN